MSVVLGIDAAWTEKEPSGVALVRSDGIGWRCVAAAPSYEEFCNLSLEGRIDWKKPHYSGCKPDVDGFLAAARRLAGADVDIAAVDMPVSIAKINGRREADNAISREFGARKCSAHSPNSDRPGVIGQELSCGFFRSGYPLATTSTESRLGRHLLEVYPHPALLSLLNRSERVRYKVSKASRFWQTGDRIDELIKVFTEIFEALRRIFGDLRFELPEVPSVASPNRLKRYEDTLDALVCAWVGVMFLAGLTKPLGDETAAIWVPSGVLEGRPTSTAS